jgi:outer membrane scaffolding protein for murein synthesis (MipA/OmpV family)
MHRIARRILAMLGLALATGTCGAQQLSAKAPLPLWELGAFGGTASTPAYPAASDRSVRSLLLPYVVYRGDVLRAGREGVDARLLRGDRYEADVGFAASLPARSDDIAVRSGMPDLGTLLEFGPRLRLKLTDDAAGGRLRLELPLRAVIEVRGGARRQGYSFEPRVLYETADERRLWNASASLSAVFGDASLNSYFYEVAPRYATAQRPAYEARSGLILTRMGLSASRALTPDWRVFGFVRYENYAGAANRDSPLFQRSSGTSAGLGAIWIWRRSTALARN